MNSMMAPTLGDKSSLLLTPLQEVVSFVEAAVHDGRTAHDVEQGLWQRLLTLGHTLFGWFLQQSGEDDVGPGMTLEDGSEVNRLGLHTRACRTVFGDYEVTRYGYGTGAGQRLAAVPLDARLGLPAETWSVLLQDWSQSLAVEVPYATVHTILERILGQRLSVHTLERHQAVFNQDVAGFWATLPPRDGGGPADSDRGWQRGEHAARTGGQRAGQE